MVVRRFQSHLAEHNWFAAAIDVAIVIIGVFIALQVNNWNQARLDAAQGRNYRARLAEELKTTEKAMNGLDTYFRSAGAHGRAALEVLEHHERPAGEAFLIDAYQASQVMNRAGRHATYDEIVSVGRLDLIGAPELRDRISNYYWRMDGILSLDSGSPAYRELLRTAMPNDVQEIIRERCDERIVDVGNGLAMPMLPGKCEAGLDPATIVATVARLRAQPGLAAALNRQLSAYDARALSARKLAVNARQVRQLIEQFQE